MKKLLLTFLLIIIRATVSWAQAGNQTQLIERYNDLVQQYNKLDAEYYRLDSRLYEADTYFARNIEECLAISHPSALLVKRAKEAASYMLDSYPYKECMLNYDAQPGPYRVERYKFNRKNYHQRNPKPLWSRRVARLEEGISQLEEEVTQIKQNVDEALGYVEDYELLYLKYVNDFLKEEYTPANMQEARMLLDRVTYNSMKDNLRPLVDNYERWLVDIADICAEAQQDASKEENRLAWKNPRDSRANVYVRKLDNCLYSKRADKSWKIPYFDELIANAKKRILMYKDKQRQPMTFDDILPREISAAYDQVRRNGNVDYRRQNGKLREIHVR